MTAGRSRTRAARTAVLVHGAGSGPWVFDGWAHHSMTLVRTDLHARVGVSNVSMKDYAEMVAEACADAPGPVALCGWSMGGLAAMMAAGLTEVAALAVLEPSAPAEVQGTNPVQPARGTFDPEEVYGAFPPGIGARPESQRARADRKRGISVPSVPRRTLVVYGDEFAEERGRAIARFYGVEEMHFPGLSHWDFVLDASVAQRVLDFLFGGFVCPVCGWPDLTEAPRSPGGGGSYEICPSCGFQFGVADENAGTAYAEWRRRWTEAGMPWSSAGTTARPPGWDPAAQLRRLDDGAGPPGPPPRA